MRRLSISFVIAAMIVVAAMTALTAWIMRDVIDAMLQAGNRAQVYAVAASVTAIFAIKGAATYVQVVALSRAGNSIVATQQRKLFDRVLEHVRAERIGVAGRVGIVRVGPGFLARTVDVLPTLFVSDLVHEGARGRGHALVPYAPAHPRARHTR